MKSILATVFASLAALVCAAGGEELNGQYMVIDLSGGGEGLAYDVSYLDSEPAEGWTDEYKSDKLVLRRVEAGTYLMGDDRESCNVRHQVRLSRSYYIGVFPITQYQYERVMDPEASIDAENPMYPATNVSYDVVRGNSRGSAWPQNKDVDESSFMGKLRARTGLCCDLPTEAQWECACRAGSVTWFCNGDDDEDLAEVGWYYDNSEGHAHDVGLKSPNAWGIYDMHGNVWEWCLDWYTQKLKGNVVDPVGPARGTDRVLKGGCWDNDSGGCTSCQRNYDFPYRGDSICGDGPFGFRLCIETRETAPLASYGPFVPGVKISVTIASLVGYAAKGLPAGLKFDSKTGTISGTPTKPTGDAGTTATFTKKSAETFTTQVVVGPLPALSISVFGGGGGKVSGAGAYPANKKVTLKATPAKGYVFSGWSSVEPRDDLFEPVDYRTPSMPFVMKAEDIAIHACFTPAEDDNYLELTANSNYVSENPDELVLNAADELPIKLVVDSVSLPKLAVSGLPAGLKYTAKQVLNKDKSVLAEANTIYGTATKPGVYTVTVKLTNSTVKKAVERKFKIKVDNLTGANDLFVDEIRNSGGDRDYQYEVRAGVKLGASELPCLELVDDGKVSVSGLPPGLKYNAASSTIEGVPTKAGTYTVYATVGKKVSTFTVEVQALPDWVVGSFDGSGDYRVTQWGKRGCYDFCFNVTVSANGKISGNVNVDVTVGKQEKSSFSVSAFAGYEENGHVGAWYEWDDNSGGYIPEYTYDGPVYYVDIPIKLDKKTRIHRLYIFQHGDGTLVDEGYTDEGWNPIDGKGEACFGDVSYDVEDDPVIFEGTAGQNLWKRKGWEGPLPKFATSTITLRNVPGDDDDVCQIALKESGEAKLVLTRGNGVRESVSFVLDVFYINDQDQFLVDGDWIFPKGSVGDIKMIFTPNAYGVITADDIEVVDIDTDYDL